MGRKSLLSAYRKSKKAVNKKLSVYSENSSDIRGVLGRYSDGAVIVDDTNQMCYVTLVNGSVIEVLNKKVPAVFEMPVIVGRDPNDMPKTLRVLRSWSPGDSNDDDTTGILYHKEQHEWPNPDAVYLRSEAWLLGGYFPNVLTVDIYPAVYYTTAGYVRKQHIENIDLASYVAALATGECQIVVICVDASATFRVRAGAVVTGWANLSDNDIPLPTAGDNTICGVKLFHGQTEIRKDGENNDFIEMRFLGVSSGSVSAANLTVKETDGAPEILYTTTLEFPNGSVTDAGSGKAQIAFPNIDTLTGSASAGEGDVLTVVLGSAVFQPPAVPAMLMLTISEDLTAQIDGITDTFTLPMQAEHVTVYCNLRLLPSQVILNDGRLTFTLDFVPAVATDNLIAEMDVYLDQLLLTESGKPLTNGTGEYLYA